MVEEGEETFYLYVTPNPNTLTKPRLTAQVQGSRKVFPGIPKHFLSGEVYSTMQSTHGWCKLPDGQVKAVTGPTTTVKLPSHSMLLACKHLPRVNHLGKALKISINHGSAAPPGIWGNLNTTTT
ncbi:hypothetical protein L195_g002544 [Trifolium pratense]|uniref:Uncharacterized protein n=1 Tax=Trifolium pratense TaxID=57577 RepID=A0A2K3NSR9_TRIPR|nr:hypothetical protein L195_g002544 [Trifolium pratense]